jgi:hypothetical protein
MTVVEYETWILWLKADYSDAYGKSWKNWYAVPEEIRQRLYHGYKTP